MKCKYCGSTEFTIKDDFRFQCDYCLSDTINKVLDDAIEELKVAVYRRSGLQEVLMKYDAELRNYSFPKVLIEFASYDYNFEVISESIYTIPVHEQKLVLSMLSEFEGVGLSSSSKESLLEKLSYSNEEETLDILKKVLVLISNEKGAITYKNIEDLDFLVQEPYLKEITLEFETLRKVMPKGKGKTFKQMRSWLKEKHSLHSSYISSCVPERVFEVEETDRGLEITGCNAKIQKVIKIPSTIQKKPVVKIKAQAFQSLSIEEIHIPFTVESLSENAIVDCGKLRKVSIGGYTIITPKNFFKCDELSTMDVINSAVYHSEFGVAVSSSTYIYSPPRNKISELVIKEGTSIGEYAFYYSRNLRKVKLNGEGIKIETNSFRLDDMSLLDVKSIDAIRKHISNQNQVSSEHIEMYESGDVDLAFTGFKQNQGTSFENDFYLALSTDGEERVQLLIDTLSLANEKEDYEKVFDELLKTPEGQIKLLGVVPDTGFNYYKGVVYFKGYNVQKDDSKARDFFLDSMSEGHLKGSLNAAVFLANGIGGQIDSIYAKRIYLSLIEDGYEQAKVLLLSLYKKHPDLVEGNIEEDIITYVNQDIEGAKELYADFLISGSFVEQDIMKAIQVLNELSEGGNGKASYQIGYLYSVDESIKDLDLAEKYMRLAISQGYSDAERALQKIRN